MNTAKMAFEMMSLEMDETKTPTTLYWLIDPRGDGADEKPATSWAQLVDWAVESYGLYPEIEKEFRENSEGPMSVDDFYINLWDYAAEHLEEIVKQHGWEIRKINTYEKNDLPSANTGA